MRVLLDACVLYSPAICDILFRLAERGYLEVRWSARILDEFVHAVLRQRPDLDETRLRRRCERMNSVFRDALVEPVPSRAVAVPQLPDPADRHVVEAALIAEVDAIVTWNLAHFPASAMDPLGIAVVTPDRLLVDCFDEDPETVLACLREVRTQLQNPPFTPRQYVNNLRRQNLVMLAGRIRPHLVRI